MEKKILNLKRRIVGIMLAAALPLAMMAMCVVHYLTHHSAASDVDTLAVFDYHIECVGDCLIALMLLFGGVVVWLNLRMVEKSFSGLIASLTENSDNKTKQFSVRTETDVHPRAH